MKNTEKFNGLFSAILTPFDDEGKVMIDSFKKLIEYETKVQKLDGFYVTGSTGEYLHLNTQERKELMRVLKEENKGNKTLIAQIAAPNMPDTYELAKYAKELGYDAISAVPPLYFGYSFEDIKSYYAEVSSITDLPFLIYYIPQLAGIKLSISQLSELIELPNVIGFKYSAPDLVTYERLKNAFPNKVIFFGVDEMLAGALAMGATGFIGSTYNAKGIEARKIIDAYKKGDNQEVLALTKKYNDYIFSLFGTGVTQTLKAMITLDGVNLGIVRRPLPNPGHQKLNQAAKKSIAIFQK